MNLMEGLLREIQRVTEMKVLYESIGMPGMFAATLMGIDLDYATKSISNNDVVAMLQAYKKLKEYEN